MPLDLSYVVWRGGWALDEATEGDILDCLADVTAIRIRGASTVSAPLRRRTEMPYYRDLKCSDYRTDEDHIICPECGEDVGHIAHAQTRQCCNCGARLHVVGNRLTVETLGPRGKLPPKGGPPTKKEKPPLGLTPRHLYEEQVNTTRIDNLLLALERYATAKKAAPLEWVRELKERVDATSTELMPKEED